MKRLLLIMIMLPLAGYSQLLGRYCDYDVFTSECFEFTSDTTFSYYSSSCTSKKIGHGSYIVSNDTMSLLFALNPIDSDVTVQTNRNIEVGALIHFNINSFKKNADGKRLYNFSYRLKNKEGKLLQSGISDSLHHISLKTIAGNEDYWLEIWYGFHLKHFILCGHQNYDISIGLPEETNMPIEIYDPRPVKYEFGYLDDCSIYLRAATKNYKGNFWGFYKKEN